MTVREIVIRTLRRHRELSVSKLVELCRKQLPDVSVMSIDSEVRKAYANGEIKRTSRGTYAFKTDVRDVMKLDSFLGEVRVETKPEPEQPPINTEEPFIPEPVAPKPKTEQIKFWGKQTKTPEGLEHFKPPPDIKGKTNHGVKSKLTFFFDTKEDMKLISDLFKEGKSRVPSGKKLVEFVRKHSQKAQRRL